MKTKRMRTRTKRKEEDRADEPPAVREPDEG
jgi:hypothetical protein